MCASLDLLCHVDRNFSEPYDDHCLTWPKLRNFDKHSAVAAVRISCSGDNNISSRSKSTKLLQE
jgi:hypothetical protein